MTRLEMVQFLYGQAKRSTQSHDDLVEVFENYKTMLGALMTSVPAYATSLRRLQEEFPDIDRLVGKKHDAVLKGRLIDAIGAFRKKVQEIEEPVVDEPSGPSVDSATPAPTPSDTPGGTDKPTRNIPTLRMS